MVVSMLTPFARRVISRTRLLKRSKAFGATTRWTSGPSVKLNPRNFRSCGRATALFVSFTELEFLRDEPRDALHHSLTRSLTTHVDIAIVGVANVTVSASHQLSVEFVEHEVTEQRRKWAPLWGPFHAGTD